MRRTLLTDLRVLVGAADALGLDGERMRALRGPEPWEDLPVPERVRRGDAIWATALAGPDPLGLPVALARRYTPDTLGALGLAMRTADTLGEGLGRLARYHALFLPAPMWRFEAADGLLARCVWAPPLAPLHVQVSQEFLVALLVHLAGEMVGRPVPVRAARFAHPARGPADALAEALGTRPAFGAPATELELDAEVVGWHLARPDPGVAAFLVGELEVLAARADEGDPRLLQEELRTWVRARLPDGPPSMAEAAKKLGTSERTLRRRLAAAGTSWEGLVERTREALARELVRGSEHGLAEVSYLLGFSDPSAFHRAFKRWTGQTPAAFRGR